MHGSPLATQAAKKAVLRFLTIENQKCKNASRTFIKTSKRSCTAKTIKTSYPYQQAYLTDKDLMFIKDYLKHRHRIIIPDSSFIQSSKILKSNLNQKPCFFFTARLLVPNILSYQHKHHQSILINKFQAYHHATNPKPTLTSMALNSKITKHSASTQRSTTISYFISNY